MTDNGTQEGLRILSLTMHRFGRISEMTLDPFPDRGKLLGKNEQGKSTVIEAIQSLISSKDQHIDRPIHNDGPVAWVEAVLDNGMTIRREWEQKEDGTTKHTLKARNADGATMKQGALDALLGKITWDPMEFLRCEKAKQFKILQGIVDTDLDFDKWDQKLGIIEEKRTEAGREKKTAKGVFDAFGGSRPEAEEERPAHGDLDKRLSVAMGEKAKFDDLSASLKRLDTAIAEIEMKLTDLRDARKGLIKMKDSMPEMPDIEALQAERAGIETRQDAFDKAERWDKAETELGRCNKVLDTLGDELSAHRKLREAALADAQFPVKGLTFGDGELLYNAHSLEEASSGMRLQIAVAIGAATSPNFKFLPVQDAALLDSAKLGEIAAIAKKYGMQVLVERSEMNEEGNGWEVLVIDDGALVERK